MFRAELIKLKRSSTWLIALILPSLAVVTGTINLANNKDALDSGWASFTSQVVLFYGLLFYSMGISLLAATVWSTAAPTGISFSPPRRNRSAWCW